MQSQGSMARSHRLHPQGEFRDQGQASPAAAEQPHQVVTGNVLHHAAPGFGFHAVAAQQADADDLIAHTQMALSQATGHASGHQAAHRAVGFSAPGPVDRKPLPMVGQQGLQLLQRHPRFHGDGQVIDGMVDDPIELAAAHGLMLWIEAWAPVQPRAKASGDPRGGCPVQRFDQRDQLLAVGGGMAHATMVP